MAQGKIQQFEKIFRELFTPLVHFALKYIPDVDEAREIVHDVFVTVWTKSEIISPDTNYRSYLYTAVRNRCLNQLRDSKKMVNLSAVSDTKYSENPALLEAEELEREIEVGIASLPEKCREIFELNRREGLKYAEIANRLGLSVKTVEAQMSKALAILREHLKEFLSLIILFLYR